MAETAHTPGPWFLEGNWCPNSHRPLGGWVSHSPPSGVPVFGLEPSVGTLEEIVANARLIAAAPDLLDALQAMYRAHHLHIFSPRGQEAPADRDTCRICGGNYRDTLQHITAQEGHPSDVKAEAARLARAALARATGEKQ